LKASTGVARGSLGRTKAEIDPGNASLGNGKHLFARTNGGFGLSSIEAAGKIW
jgi:hypothetical protein